QGEAGRSVKTLANYHGHVRDIWTPALGEARLRDLRRADVVQVLTKALEPTGGKGDGREVCGTVPARSERPGWAQGGGQGRGRGNVGRRVERRSVSTVEGYRRTLRSALSAAQRQGLIAVNPAMGPIDGLYWPAPTDAAVGPRAWEPVQTAAFLEFITGTDGRLAALFEVAAYTGLRRGELCGLRWSDLDADGRGLRVRHNLVEVARDRIPAEQRRCTLCGDEHVGRVLKGPKSRAGRRWVPLAVPAQTALRGQRERQAVDRRRPYRDHDLVFAAPDGDPLRPNAVSAEFSQLVRACGLPQIRLHDLRHSACSLLLAGGVPLEVVQMILGHAAPSVTRRVYAHILRDPTAEQVNQATDLITRHIPTPSLVSRSTCPVSNGEHP
ncbi:MAG: tyrosine-type recombinase/integrase, partial [Kineosporiaceae bacterium]